MKCRGMVRDAKRGENSSKVKIIWDKTEKNDRVLVYPCIFFSTSLSDVVFVIVLRILGRLVSE